MVTRMAETITLPACKTCGGTGLDMRCASCNGTGIRLASVDAVPILRALREAVMIGLANQGMPAWEAVESEFPWPHEHLPPFTR